MKAFFTRAPAFIAIVIMIFVSLFGFKSSTYAQATDPESVFNAFNAAVNAHEVDTALAFFTTDAVAQFPNQPPPNIYRGQEQLREWLQADAAQNIQVKTENAQVGGDTVMATAKVDVDDVRELGLTLEGLVEVVVENGKIKSFTYTLSEDTLAKLQAATPPSLPATGASLAHTWALVMVGLGILTFGFGVTLRRRQF